MHLVLSILAALIIFKWLQTGEIWDVLAGVVGTIALIVLVIISLAIPVFGVFVVVVLIICGLHICLEWRRQATLRKQYPDPTDRIAAEQKEIRRSLGIPDPPNFGDPQWREWRSIADDAARGFPVKQRVRKYLQQERA